MMILGFLSLLLTFGQSYIVKICIPANLADKLLPCEYRSKHDVNNDEEHRRKLLFYEHRYLSEDATPYKCKEGREPLISVNGLHQLHILIFFLAVLHVIYSAVTMLLGRLKVCASFLFVLVEEYSSYFALSSYSAVIREFSG
ncbi:MLO-like protein 8-like [Trifolium medium]|uniref:MLO-like protein 8-like n=1 Tax=Trifolium medium TaxID=97028 RepID=A0A392NC90_9FABA|nr:MLO-like protein 8-like [Trifolium medium]